ncbi:Methyltransferase domain-containing protein [Butyrivibrio fibrisolvens]|uniref:Methyltransferase domain-containing protein n=1 Tax=Butyrivibrio fibrisolvens TaxID=831 RepID=A0A1H9V7Y0_BUTFI|nr:SAM-dependent methyltransferase [Butyrivibrio fibrisolvens]SES17347.1 Methyltransferase domain-containing protein [Butyrivibrio fibrisolvens]
MNELEQYIKMMVDADVKKMIISNPTRGTNEFKKLVVEIKSGAKYQISKYTKTQVFHENLGKKDIASRCYELTEGLFKQINGMSDSEEHIILISKKGKATYKVKKKADDKVVLNKKALEGKKNYILEEGMKIPPLVDMGVFTSDGSVVKSKYDKYKQINRFIEILDDEISQGNITKLNVIDFGCGKSYLTFVVYYYLTKIKNIEVNMIGLDLKESVIKNCNEAAKKYGYDKLHFELGDINGYKTPFDVDMFITLHACDTATDFALYNAVMWNAKMIFSVPCCQHELNKQIKTEDLNILSRYGIIKERFCALATDAIRANILECQGYKTQILEFVDFDNTPKNLLIRAVRRPTTPKSKIESAKKEIESMIQEFGFAPTLYNLLMK